VRLDPADVARLTIVRRPRGWLRVTPLVHAATPLGLGHGETRFASPSRAFRVLYLGRSLMTGIAETVIRDRFVGRVRRRVSEEEILAWGIAAVTARDPLSLLDLRSTGPVRLGIATDTVRAKSHKAGRAFSEALYRQVPVVDGILYASRLTNAPCIAVYDRAVAKLEAGAVLPLVTQPALIPALAALDVTVIAAEDAPDAISPAPPDTPPA
jgi:hypothetical protein